MPVIIHELIGRDEDIMKFFNDRAKWLGILYGPPGIGKSEIILHVGHEMLESGYDVHYIKVDDFASVESLQHQPAKISGVKFERDMVMKWNSNKTLLILDNFDGSQNENFSRERFMKEFVDVLLRFST